MKKYLLLLLVACIGICSSCKYDDSELWGSVDELANRVSALETLTQRMNGDISALQAVVTAVENQVSISEVEKLTDGYILHFTNGTTATIKNGKNGQNGTDGTDGKDGQNGTDGKDGQDGEDGKDGQNGTNGANGADGKAPVVTITGTGYWAINGVATSVKAVGEKGIDGDSMFTSVENKNGVLVITLAGGEVYQLPLVPEEDYITYKDSQMVKISTDNIPLTSGGIVLHYETLLANASVEVISAPVSLSVSVDEGNKTLTVTGTVTAGSNKVVLLFYNANQTITSVLTFQTQP